jgi:shikimate kinase
LSLPQRGPGRPSRKCVLLVGMMGAGKSTVANLLAGWLGWPQVDTDSVVEKRAGATVAEIFAGAGEDAFRTAESTAIAELTDLAPPLVVSVGGGAVLREENRRGLRAAGTVVWLRAEPGTLAARVGDGGGRPLLVSSGLEPKDALEKLVAERRGYYEEVADVVIDVDRISSDEAARLVMESLAASSALDAP